MEELNCPVDSCEDCEFNRSQSWCARALPDYKGHTELEKIRMEGFVNFIGLSRGARELSQ